MSNTNDLHGSTAVITGAAGGIGSALARGASTRGARLILADIDGERLALIEEELLAAGADARAFTIDVADPEAVDELAARCHRDIGPVHLLCNQAGVIVSGESWLAPPEDWRWVMGVNLGGVVNTLRSFLPRMLDHGRRAHVVNSASIGALLTEPLVAPYVVALRGVITLSESLHHELRSRGADIGVSVVCAGAVAATLADSESRRPAHLARPAGCTTSDVAAASMARKVLGMAAGADPADVANHVLDAVEAGRFWIFHPDVAAYEPKLRTAFERMVAGLVPEEAFAPPRPST